MIAEECAVNRHRRRTTGPALVAVLVAAVGLSLRPDAAAALAGGTWGPNHVPYADGVICSSAGTDTALVAWPGPAGNRAFALGAVSGPAGGLPGPTDEPAVNGTSARATPAGTGLDATHLATMAYLISAHANEPTAGVIGDVAAALVDQSGGDPAVTNCLASQSGGTSLGVAAQLSAEASDRAGPYTVTVSAPSTPIIPGTAVPVTAEVTAASGAPAAGVQVRFSPADPNATLSSPSAMTDPGGQAQVAVTVARSAAARTLRITATVSAPVGLIETTAPGAVPLVSAAPPTTFTGSADLLVDTAPDPVLTLASAGSLLLAGSSLPATLGVTGMHAHSGTATVTTYGPLALAPKTGCSAHTAAEWARLRAAHTMISSDQLTVRGDGTYAVPPVTSVPGGCYRLGATITTTDATRNVTRAVTGPVVTVVPVTLGAVPPGHGVAPLGALSTLLTATSRYPVTLQGVGAQVLGPRAPAADGTCPTTGWTGAATAEGTAAASSSGAAAVRITTVPVHATGCYGLRITASVALAELGSVPVTIEPGATDPTVLVLAPTVSVVDLSQTSVPRGGHVDADVVVSATDAQPGSLRLKLLHLPYTWRGCFGADWTKAEVTDAGVGVATSPTAGDNTYTVRTPAVPSDGCWTVAPVFTASANPAVTVTGAVGVDPMLAFTGLDPVRSRKVLDTAAAVPTTDLRLDITAVATALLLAVTFLMTVSSARRSRLGDQRIPTAWGPGG